MRTVRKATSNPNEALETGEGRLYPVVIALEESEAKHLLSALDKAVEFLDREGGDEDAV